MSRHRARIGAFVVVVAGLAIAVAPGEASAQESGPPAGAFDRDNDGIPDRIDACPDTPGDKTADPTTDGCPNHPWVPQDRGSDRARAAERESAGFHSAGVILAVGGAIAVAVGGLLAAAVCLPDSGSYGCLAGLIGGGTLAGVGVISGAVGLILIATNRGEAAVEPPKTTRLAPLRAAWRESDAVERSAPSPFVVPALRLSF